MKREKQHQKMKERASQIGAPHTAVKGYWDKTKELSMYVANETFDPDAYLEQIIEATAKHAPKYRKRKYRVLPSAETGCLFVDVADLHIGKLAYKNSEIVYDMGIAEKRILKGVSSLESVLYGKSIEQIYFVGGNDVLNTENGRTTTKGTPQDNHGTWFENFDRAFFLYIELIEQLSTIAPVHYIHVPSNHDRTSGYALGRRLEAFFSKDKGTTFDVSPEYRRYVKYGVSLVGLTHGDGAKASKLPMLMAQEAKADWSESKLQYYYIHHYHTKKMETVGGVICEWVSSPSEPDDWHLWSGYASPCAFDVFWHGKKTGARLSYTHFF